MGARETDTTRETEPGDLKGSQHTLDTCLNLSQLIVLMIGIPEHERGLRKQHRIEQNLSVFPIGLGQLVETHAEVETHIGKPPWSISPPTEFPASSLD
jgi:hypothetical protein